MENLYEALKTQGFTVWPTGGGCTAWGKKLDETAYMLVTGDTGGTDDLSDGAIIALYETDNIDPLNSWCVDPDQVLEWVAKAAQWLGK